MSETQYFETNRQLWNARARAHVASKFYDVDGFLKGKSTLNPAELEALGDVSGKKLLHLQCHFGLDSLSFARMGAQVTGVDLSDVAIDQARDYNNRLGLDAEFVTCNVYDAPRHLDGKFDIVFTSYGVLCWLPDLERWADVVRHCLAPGGTFLIAEFHPALMMFDFDSFRPEYGYFNGGATFEEVQGTYADPEADVRGGEYFWNHSLAEMVTPLLDRGIRIVDFREFPYSYYPCYPNMKPLDEGKYVFRDHPGKVPLMFLLKGVLEA